MNLQPLLDNGLTEHEARIYLTLLKHGQLSAYHLADKAGLYRQATYDALNRLEEKGFVSSVKQERSKQYRATDPEHVLEHIKKKVEAYTSILPQLQGLANQAKDPLVVETYKGSNAVRIALRDVVKQLKETKGENLASVEDELPISQDKTVLDEYQRDILHYGIKERVIVQDGVKGLLANSNSAYRTLPKDKFNPLPTQIYGDNVQFIVWGQPNHVIIIRNKSVAEGHRKQFELLWSIAKAVKK